MSKTAIKKAAKKVEYKHKIAKFQRFLYTHFIMSEAQTKIQIGTLKGGSPPTPDPLQWLEKIGRNMKTGGEIPSLSPEVQEDLRTRLSACETRLNQLFPSAIQTERKNIAATTKFMDTPEFFEEAILEADEVPKDLK